MTRERAKRLRSQKWQREAMLRHLRRNLEWGHLTQAQHDGMLDAYEAGNEWALALREAREAGDEFLITELEGM